MGEAPSWLLSPPSNRCGSPNKSTTSLAHPSSTGSASKPPASRPPPPTTTSCPPPPTPPPSAFLNYLTHKTNIPWNILHFWTSFLFLIYKPCVHSNFFSNGRNKKTLSRFCQLKSNLFLFQTPSHQNSLDSKSK